MELRATLRYLRTRLVELNLFENSASRTDIHHLRTAIIFTRVYLVLLITVVVILILTTALEQTTQTVTVQSPSENVFQKLYLKYSSTLQCQCNQVETLYKTFTTISYKLHPVCSSVFVSSTWINILFNRDIAYFHPLDFRSSASGQFQLLTSLCLFANRTIENAIDDFLSDTLLSPQILSISSLKDQSETKSQFLKTSTSYTYSRLLNLVRGITHMNVLLPAMQTSMMHLLYVIPNVSITPIPYETLWNITTDEVCYCGFTSNCYSPSAFYDLFAEQTQAQFTVMVPPLANATGFSVACYALDALLASSLQCFFDSSCFTSVLTFFPSRNITHHDILQMNQTHYAVETTIETLANNLFLEQWSSEISFSAYYSACAPILCVYGGLIIVLRVCASNVVSFWRNRNNKDAIKSDLHNTLGQRLIIELQKIKVRIIEFNLFKTALGRTNSYELETTRITTRAYIVIMLFSLGIISIYLLFSTRVKTVIVQYPSITVFKNLHNKYENTLQCPCTRIVNAYELFTSLSYTFHPICSSLFISNEWIVSILSTDPYDALDDIRVLGPTFFETLATFCSLSNITTDNAWYIFQQTPLVTDFVLTETEFQTEIKISIEQFKKNTISEFQRVLSLSSLHTKTMYAAGYLNIMLSTNESSSSNTPIDFGWKPAERTTCSCDLNDQCYDVMGLFSYTLVGNDIIRYTNFSLPDILIGCVVVSSVLQSSLSCFFNQTCFDRIHNSIQTTQSINISILDLNNTRFSPHDHIETIMNSLMIETWNEKIDYDKYYEQCAPEQCTYVYTSANNPFQTVTVIIGLFGGLSVVMKIVVQFVVRWIRNQTRLHPGRTVLINYPPVDRRVTNFWHSTKSKLLELNLFKTELSWDDDQRHRREILTTRLYLLLLIIAVIIVLIYTCIDTQTEIIKVLNPSQEVFDQLRSHPQYSSTLDCPCTNITVRYQSFIFIKPYYHQLCSSDFVTRNSTWISLLYSSTAGIDYAYNDYHLFAASHFELLSSLCTLVNETMTEAINEFLRNIMINARVQSRENIESQANTALNRFCLSTPRTFVLILDFIRYMNQGNGIVSSILSNWHFISSDTVSQWDSLWALPHSYGNDNCSCGTSSMCISEASFNGLVIPGLHVGCYPFESLLQSTLECLYNISCIDQLESMYNYSNITFNPLNNSLSSANTTVQSLIETLFVEKWETNV
ncbi:unnamed protein product, partial [Adineta steineri]